MSPQIGGAAPCHVRYIASDLRHNVVAWVTDAESDVGAVIVRDGILEVLWMSQMGFYDNIAFHDGHHIPDGAR